MAPRGERPSRRCASILEASLEVRSAIVYATLINVVAVVPDASSSTASRGSFFQPLALAYVLAIARLDVVALTVTPALSLILLTRGPARAPASRPWCAGSSAATARSLSLVIRRPADRLSRGRRRPADGRRRSSRRGLGEELFPSFKEHDFLMHWITEPGTSLPEERRMVTRSAARSSAAIPGVRRLRLAHRPGVPRRGDRRARTSASSGSASTRTPTTTRRIAQIAGGRRRATPGLFRDVQTYLNERINEVLIGDERADRGADLRRRPRRPARQGRTRSQRVIAGRPGGRRTCTSSCRSTCRSSTSRSTSTRRAATGSSRATCAAPPATLVAGEEVGEIFRARKMFDVMVWSTPETRNSADGDPQPADRHARPAGTSRSPTSPTCAIRPTPNVIKREGASRRIDVGAERPRAATSASVVARRRETGSTACHVRRAGTTPSSSASTPSGEGRSSRLLALALVAGAGHLPAPPGRVRQLAAGVAGVPHPARSRWSAASLAAYARRRRCSRSARWSASSPCSGSPRATGSCWSATSSTSSATRASRSARRSCSAAPGSGSRRSS